MFNNKYTERSTFITCIVLNQVTVLDPTLIIALFQSAVVLQMNQNSIVLYHYTTLPNGFQSDQTYLDLECRFHFFLGFVFDNSSRDLTPRKLRIRNRRT